MDTAESTFGMPVDGPKKTDIPGAIAAIATISAVGVAVGLSFPLLSILMEQRGYSSTLIGANTAMAGIASMGAVPLVNPLARRLGLVNMLVLAAALAGASLMGFFYFQHIAAWFLLRITLHGAITASFVLSEYWINSAAPENRRGFVLGIYATVLSAGFASGPALLAAIGSKGILPFAAGTAIMIASLVPALLARARQPKTDGQPQSPSVLRYVLLVPAATIAGFIFGAVEQAGLALFPVYGARNGYDETGVALLLTVLALGNVALQIPLGMMSDRMRDRRYLLLACAGIGVAGVGLLPLAIPYTTLLVAGIFVWGGVTAGMYTVGLAHLGARLSGADLAQANAAFILCYAIGMVIGPQLVGIAMDMHDPHGFAWAMSGLFLTYVVLALSRVARQSR